jgi:L-threonylcarbamoyladenylate synthase
MIILKIKKENFQKILKITLESIKQGKVIVCPTDTVYGLICDAKNKKAVRKIFKIKKRSFQKPISIFIKDLKMAKKFAQIDKKQEMFLKKYWPGKTIAILKATKIRFPRGIVCQWGKIGLRIPKHKLLNELLNKFNGPLAQTSANISGKPVPATIKEILKQFDKKYQPDISIDAGKLSGKSSKVIDLTISPPKILRP